jgi:hypothetical protein
VEFTALLDAAGGLFFKIWKLDPDLGKRAAYTKKVGIGALVATAVLGAVVPGVLLCLALHGSVGATTLLTCLGFVLAGVAFAVPVLGLIAWLIVRRKYAPLPHFAMGAVLYLFVSPVARHHMRSYEEKYLQRGRR